VIFFPFAFSFFSAPLSAAFYLTLHPFSDMSPLVVPFFFFLEDWVYISAIVPIPPPEVEACISEIWSLIRGMFSELCPLRFWQFSESFPS